MTVTKRGVAFLENAPVRAARKIGSGSSLPDDTLRAYRLRYQETDGGRGPLNDLRIPGLLKVGVSTVVLGLLLAHRPAMAQICPTEIGNIELANPIIVPKNSSNDEFFLTNGQSIIVSTGANTSGKVNLDSPATTIPFAIDGAGANRFVVCGTVGVTPGKLNPGGGIRTGSNSEVRVAAGGTIFGNRNAYLVFPGIELLGPGSSVTVDSGGLIQGNFAPAVRANAPINLNNFGTVAVTGADGYLTVGIDLASAVGSVITNSGAIDSGSASALTFRDARGIPGGETQITNSGTIIGRVAPGLFGAGAPRFDSIDLRRGLVRIDNTGSIGGIAINQNPDDDGFSPASGLVIVNHGGSIGPVSVAKLASGQSPTQGFSSDLRYDLDITNGANSRIGFIPGENFAFFDAPLGLASRGVTHASDGKVRITNAGTIEGHINSISFAGGDAVIVNQAGGIIRTSNITFFSPLFYEGHGIFGFETTGIGPVRPSIDNSGTVYGAISGISVFKAAANVINRSVLDGVGAVVSGGSIGGNVRGISLGGGSVINERGATIFTSNSAGPGFAPDGSTSAVNFSESLLSAALVNHGTITSSGSTTVYAAGPLLFYNGPDGRIEETSASSGFGRGVNARGNLASNFVNDGLITAYATTVTVAGRLNSALAFDIVNNGTITSRSDGTAVFIEDAGGRYINAPNAVTNGTVSLGGLQNGSSSPSSGSVDNSSLIKGSVSFNYGGTLDNRSSGTITSTSTSNAAVQASLFNNFANTVLTVRNSGSISGVNQGIHANKSRVHVDLVNRTGGNIAATGFFGVGVEVDGSLSLVNEVGASISGTLVGVQAGRATRFDNAGSISGRDQGAVIQEFAGADSESSVFRNSGSISSSAGVATFVKFSATGRLENSGIISGNLGLNLEGQSGDTTAIFNTGDITGSESYGIFLARDSFGTLENSGLVEGFDNGIHVRIFGGASITNKTGGVIRTNAAGTGKAGIAILEGSGSILNEVGGTISAPLGNNQGREGAIYISSDAGAVSVENRGLLRGVNTFQADNATDLRNSGEILATQTDEGDAVNIILGGVFRNEAGGKVIASRDAVYIFDAADNGTVTDIFNAVGATISGDSDGNGTGFGIASDDDSATVSGIERVFNAGAITGGISLGLNNDRLELTATGTVSGASVGGGGVDVLRIDTASGSARTLTEGQFAQFEDIVLNPTLGAAGRYVITAAADPATTATLDAGSVNSSITLARGELNVRDSASSVRAALVTTAADSTLSGNGTVFGNTSVAGTISPGNSVGHLTIAGNLTLASTSLLAFELGAADVVGGPLNDLVSVNGNLVLDGRLTVAQSGGGNFAAGVYRLINYGGSITDNVLDIAGVLPNGLLGTVQTGVAGQVNLVITGGGGGPIDIGYWDGTGTTPGNIVGGRGGTARWDSTTTNWTTQPGDGNGPWDLGVGVFGGATGKVTVDGVQAFMGLQFVTNNYHLVAGADGALALGAGAFIHVDEALDTRISVAIKGAGTLDKRGAGRLVLDGVSSYGGGTLVSAGTLAVGSDTALGRGAVNLANGTTLQAAADVALANTVVVDAPTDTRVTIDSQGYVLTLASGLTGNIDDSVRKAGGGSLVLAADGSIGRADLAGGTLRVASNATFAVARELQMAASTTLAVDAGSALTTGLAGVIGEAGSQRVINAGRIDGAVTLGRDDDRYELADRALQNGVVDGGAGADVAAFDVRNGNLRVVDGDNFQNFELVEKTGLGTLRLTAGDLAAARVSILGGRVENETVVMVTDQVVLGASAIVWANNADSVVTAQAGSTVAISATSARVGVENAGTISGDVRFSGSGNSYVLLGTGIQAGSVDGGGARIDNRLQIETATRAVRELGAADFVNFDTVILNNDALSTGMITLQASTDPVARATLDAGVGPESSITLANGELKLRDAASSVRATSVTAGVSTTVSGNGTVYSSNALVAGRLAPGNSVGQLNVVGNLALAPTTLLDFELGQADVVGGPLNDLVTVTGNLALDGQISVTQSVGGNFGIGVYRLINYGNALTDNGLDILSPLPNNLSGVIQTAVSGQVNLIVSSGLGPIDIGYWDGPNSTAGNVVGGRGGTAVWNAANTNWTTPTGNANGPWDSDVGVFGGATGTVTVDGVQAFTGLQFVTGDYRLQTGAGGGLDLGTGGFVHVDTGLDATLAVAVSGTGSLSKQGFGRLILTDFNGYLGGTVVSAGTLAVGNSGALGMGLVSLADGTMLQAFAAGLTLANDVSIDGVVPSVATVDTQAHTFTLSGIVSGVGILTKIGSGTLVLNGADAYTSGTALTAGTIRVGTNSALGSGGLAMSSGTTLQAGAANLLVNNGIAIAGGATVDVNGELFTLAGVISGEGPLSVIDSRPVAGAVLVLTGTNSYTGGTVITGTTVAVGQDASLGIPAAGITLAGGTLRTTASLATTRAITLGTGGGTLETIASTAMSSIGVVSGTALTKAGTGTLALNAANTYAGGTRLNAGTISIGTASALGTGILAMADGTTLVAGANNLSLANTISTAGVGTLATGANTLTVTGVVSGSGGLVKTGTGLLTMSGASRYAGPTVVAGGTLNVPGSLASAVTVNSGAALTGTGTVGAINVQAGGSVSPGAPGTTNVATLTATGAASLAGAYSVDIVPTANDRITASGALSVAGTMAVSPTGSFQFGASYTVASGSVRSGTFGTVTGLDRFGAVFDPFVDYTANAVIIRLLPQRLETLCGPGLGGNALETARSLDRAVAGGFNPQSFFQLYVACPTTPEALQQISGEQRAIERRVVLDSTRVIRETAFDRLNLGIAAMGGSQRTVDKGDAAVTVWLRGAGAWGSARSNPNASGYSTTQKGVLTGVDWSRDGLTLGGMFHYTATDIDYRTFAGTSDIESTGGSLYAGYRKPGGIIANVGASVAGLSARGNRVVSIPGLAQTLVGTTHGTGYQVFAELGFDLGKRPDTHIEPFARLSYVKAAMGALNEAGGTAALSAAKQSYDITLTNLGMRIGGEVGATGVLLNSSVSWQAIAGNRDAATLIGLPATGQTSRIRSVAMDRSSALLQTDAAFNLSKRAKLSVSYSALFGNDNDDQAVRATLGMSF